MHYLLCLPSLYLYIRSIVSFCVPQKIQRESLETSFFNGRVETLFTREAKLLHQAVSRVLKNLQSMESKYSYTTAVYAKCILNFIFVPRRDDREQFGNRGRKTHICYICRKGNHATSLKSF